MNKKVIVIGAGIGGLCTAISLIKEGFDVQVFEKASQLTDVGAGIVLAANALNALANLGIEKNVVSNGVHVGKAEIRRWDGKLIVELPTHDQAKLYGTYSYLIHRARLVSILVNKLSDAKIRFNKKLVNFTQTENNVTAFFSDGTKAEADLLIGADGIHSVVRQQLFGEQKLRYAGYTAFRGICEIDVSQYQIEDGGGFEAWGSGKRFGFSHLGEGKVFWFAAINSQEGNRTQAQKRREIIKKYFKDWYSPVQLTIEATEESSILHHDIYDLPPLKHWSNGRVMLLGDAAHPMLPNLGQGGAQAIEDAIVLTQSLKGNGSLQDAIQRYEHIRKQRTQSITKQSRKMARVVQLENPLTIQVRNFVLENIPKKLIINRLNWILGHKTFKM